MVTVRDALFALLGVCDGAKRRDEHGYNGGDAMAARKMAAYINDGIWTHSMEAKAYRMLNKYKDTQLPAFGIDYDLLTFETKPGDDLSEEEIQVRRKEAWQKRWAQTHPDFQPLVTAEVNAEGKNILVLKSPFRFKETAKAIPLHRWDAERKVWTYLPENSVLKIIRNLFEDGRIDISDEVHALFDSIFEKPKLEFADNMLILRSDFEFRGTAKSVPNAKWDREHNIWTYPAIAETLRAFELLIQDGAIEATPEIAPLIERLNWRQKQIEVAARIKAGDVPDIPVPLKTKPYDHQKKAFLFAEALDASALFMEQGTGKTFPSLAVAGKRFIDGKIKRLLVIAPNSVLPVWPMEFEKHAAFPYRIVILGSQSTNAKASKLLNWKDTEGLQVAVINYESAWRIKDAIFQWVGDNTMVELDESQKIKNREAKQAQFCHELGDKVRYKLILTGTPMTSKEGIVDFWSQYRFLNPDIFGTNFYKFRAEHCIMGGYENKEIIGWQHPKITSDMAYQIAFRCTKAECLDLPPMVDQTMYCKLSAEAKKLYEAALRELRDMFNTAKSNGVQPERNNILTNMMKRRRIASGFIPKTKDDDGSDGVPVKLVSDHKLKLLKEILDDFPREKKLVIFAAFRAEIGAIEELVKGTGRTCVTMTGDTKVDTRGEYIKKFQNDSGLHVFIIQIQTGNMGITLHAADTVIYYSLNYTFGDYDQSKARIHRSGQTAEACTYIHLLTEGTIDESMYDSLARKKDAADVIIDKIRRGEYEEPEKDYEQESLGVAEA